MNAQPREPGEGLKSLAAFTLEIETQRRQIEIAMSIVDACRLANDSMLVPMYAPPDPDEEEDEEGKNEAGETKESGKDAVDGRDLLPEPDLEGALAMVWIILNGVGGQLEVSARSCALLW